MYQQGYSLGKQLRVFMPAIAKILDKYQDRKVWFLGRDMDVFYGAFKRLGYSNIRYLVGLNRECCGKMYFSNTLVKWLRAIGVKDGDIFIDTGFAGSIIRTVLDDGVRVNGYLLSSLGAFPQVDESWWNRSPILALEHSPKREVVIYDVENNKPIVRYNQDKRVLKRAKRFYEGCVDALVTYMQEADR